MTVHQLHPKETCPENLSLLNRRCKAALGKLGVGLDNTHLYSLQLAQEALDRGWYLPKGDALNLIVGQMFGWKPQEVYKYLEENEDGDPQELVGKKNASPEDLAAAILGEIEFKLSLPSGSNYPTLPPKSWGPFTPSD